MNFCFFLSFFNLFLNSISFSFLSAKAVRLSYDHKPSNEDEDERIRALRGYVVPVSPSSGPMIDRVNAQVSSLFSFFSLSFLSFFLRLI